MVTRPSILNTLFLPVERLKGIGPKMATKVARAAGPRVVDLVWHLPFTVIDWSYRPRLAEAEQGRLATVKLQVDKHMPPHNKRVPYRIRCSDDTGFVTLVFFHANEDYLRRMLPEGETRLVSGRIEDYSGELQIIHPDRIAGAERDEALPDIEPVYRTTEGLSPKVLARAVAQAAGLVPDLPEWIDPPLKAREGWPNFRDAVTAVHHPQSELDLLPVTPARQRLAYDEMFAHQLSLAIARRHMKKPKGRPLAVDPALMDRLRKRLPFPLTAAQDRAIGEIFADLQSEKRMIRLLQGDVGSGKTVVALATLLAGVSGGVQGVMMAPTEVLAQQHYDSFATLLNGLDIKLGFLSGSLKTGARRQLMNDLADGSIDILVATHAAFQQGVTFHNLGVAVVDEQHRFGVHQRMLLSDKGLNTDMLVMTATPIPRSLALTLYGDLDVSVLDEKPKGRKPILTSALPMERLDEVVASVGRSLKEGNCVYWICPLVEESELIDLTAAEDRFKHLSAAFPGKVGLVHGRLSAAEKDKQIRDFLNREIQILVATTVVEVGVDVPHATAIIIEHAERFGLAQLHQLRGRVGRSEAQSSCLLLYDGPLGATAKARLAIMRQTNDGFRIAEEDLRLRGAGDVLGTRQSGVPLFRLADLEAHGPLLAVARDDARLVLDNFRKLDENRRRAVSCLLSLFEHDEKLALLLSG